MFGLIFFFFFFKKSSSNRHYKTHIVSCKFEVLYVCLVYLWTVYVGVTQNKNYSAHVHHNDIMTLIKEMLPSAHRQIMFSDE